MCPRMKVKLLLLHYVHCRWNSDYWKTYKELSDVKADIADHFEVKDMNELHYFLEIKVVQDHKAGNIWLFQVSHSKV